MNLPALSAAIVHAIRNSRGDSNHNLATVVQNMIAEAMEKESEPPTPMLPLFSTPKELNDFRIKAQEAFVRIVRENCLRVEQLTEAQCTQAIIQAFQSGDFQRLVRVSDGAQQVVYLPFAESESLKAQLKQATLPMPTTIRIFGTDYPVMCILGDGWFLVAHPNGPAIGKAEPYQFLGSLAHPCEDIPEKLRTQAIEALMNITRDTIIKHHYANR